MDTTDKPTLKNSYGKLGKVCPQCNNTYKVRAPSELKTRKYCSKKCQMESFKKEKISIKCKECHKEILVTPCFVERQYCSLECKCIASRKIKDSSLRQCNKCKKILAIEEFYTIKKGYEYRCKICQRKRNQEICKTPSGRFSFSKSLAKRRKLEWTISKKDYFKLIQQNCYYCDSHLDFTGVGLDRKNNKKGYLIKNVVPCCGLCNITRADNYSCKEMLILAESIKKIKKNRQMKAK